MMSLETSHFKHASLVFIVMIRFFEVYDNSVWEFFTRTRKVSVVKSAGQPCPAFRHCCHQIAAATSWRAHFYISQCDNCRAICQSIAMALYGYIL